MTRKPMTRVPIAEPTETVHLAICDSFRDVLDVLEALTVGLDGKAADVAEAAIRCACALDDAGFRFVRVIDDPRPIDLKESA